MLLQVVTAYYSLDGAEILGFVCAVVMSAVNITLDLIGRTCASRRLIWDRACDLCSYLLALMSLDFISEKKTDCFVL